MYNINIGGEIMSLSRINEFNKFKEEMKNWGIEKEKKKVRVSTYIWTMIISLSILIGIGVLIETQRSQAIKENLMMDSSGGVFDITQYGDFSEEFINSYVNKNTDYIIEDISSRYLEEDELINYTKSELALIRNEIFAKHGYMYETEPYITYFENKYWYEGYRTDISYDELTLEEQSNIKLIKSLEDKLSGNK